MLHTNQQFLVGWNQQLNLGRNTTASNHPGSVLSQEFEPLLHTQICRVVPAQFIVNTLPCSRQTNQRPITCQTTPLHPHAPPLGWLKLSGW